MSSAHSDLLRLTGLVIFMLTASSSTHATQLKDITEGLSPVIAKYFPATNQIVTNKSVDKFKTKAALVLSPVGGAVSIGTAPEDIDFAKSHGRIFEEIAVDMLPDGIYTFAIAADATVRFGAAVNNWELGTKHLHLALGFKHIVSAGEILVEQNSAEVRLASGTFMNHLSPPERNAIAESTKEFFQAQVSSSGFRVIRGSSDETFLKPIPLPTSEEVKILCAPDSAFLKVSNERILGSRKAFCSKEEIIDYMK